jgi:hypothetical protein
MKVQRDFLDIEAVLQAQGPEEPPIRLNGCLVFAAVVLGHRGQTPDIPEKCGRGFSGAWGLPCSGLRADETQTKSPSEFASGGLDQPPIVLMKDAQQLEGDIVFERSMKPSSGRRPSSSFTIPVCRVGGIKGGP